MDKDFQIVKKLIGKWFKKHSFLSWDDKVKLSQPCFSQKEVMAVLKVLLLSGGWIVQGPKVEEFERRFAKYIGMKEAVATNSGSSANLLAMSALFEVRHLKRGDEVIVPSTTFPTVVTPILQLGLTPVFVDVEIDGNINADEIKKAISKKTKMVIVVHTLGKPAKIQQIKRNLKGTGILLFEDCCEAHGAMIEGKKVGSFGQISTFSFYVAHNMTTGEGGMVLTNNPKYSNILKSLREFGRVNQNSRFGFYPKLGEYDKRYVFERIGYNLRMTDFQAAIGIEQLQKLDAMNKKREKIAHFYLKNLENLSNYFYLPTIESGITHVFYGFLLIVKPEAPFARRDVVNFLESHNIETRPLFGGCLPDQPAFRNQPKKVVGELPVSRLLRDRAFFIGCHPGLSFKDTKHVVDTLHRFIKKYRLR